MIRCPSAHAAPFGTLGVPRKSHGFKIPCHSLSRCSTRQFVHYPARRQIQRHAPGPRNRWWTVEMDLITRRWEVQILPPPLLKGQFSRPCR